MKSIPELKKLILKADKPHLSSFGSLHVEYKKIDIEVCGNNIIKINNKPISWVNLQDLIYNGDYNLVLSGNKIENKTSHGGYRLPGPGKKIGRPKSDNRKIPTSFTLSRGTIAKLDYLSDNQKMSKSEVISHLIEAANIL